MKRFLNLAVIFWSMAAFSAPVIFSGNDVKTLKSNIDLNGQSKIMSGTVDPTATATAANPGSIYLNTSTGTNYRKLDSGSTTNWVNNSVSTLLPIAPTVQTFGVSGSSGTYTRPANIAWIHVRMVGAGGGGSGSGTAASGGTGSAGGQTSFGTSALLVANGGGAGANTNGNTSGAGGTGGIASSSTVYGTAVAGGNGAASGTAAAGVFTGGGVGGGSAFGGAGGSNSSGGGINAPANSGAGGAGAQGCSGCAGGSGGGAGAYVDAIIVNPAATYAYAVGALGGGGIAGTSGFTGGSGGSGYIEVTEYYGSPGTAILNPSSSAQIWSGYHDNTCSWARTNTAYGDPTADTTCSLVQRQNINFGTVTTYGGTNTLPGIVLTPASTAIYEVCGSAKFTGTSLGAIIDIRLWDNNNSVEIGSAQEADFLSTGDQQFSPICGFFQGAAGVSQTISLQTRMTSGTVTLVANSTSNSEIDWTVKKISQSFPMPVIANSVVTGSSGVERVERAKFGGAGGAGTNCTTSPCTTSQQSGSGTVATRTGAGIYVVTFGSAYSAPPTCVCNAYTAGSSGQRGCSAYNTTATGIGNIESFTIASTPADVDAEISVICQGPK